VERIRVRLHRTLSDDRGASVIEFVMMSVLLIVLLFAVLQVAIFVYARNVVAASAADGARFAANAGIDAQSGSDRASQLIRSGLSKAAADRIPCTGRPSTDAQSGLTVATVHCVGRLQMVLLPFALPMSIDVTSSALKEGGR
jgi:Flp pilus assembly protein TadG